MLEMIPEALPEAMLEAGGEVGHSAAVRHADHSLAPRPAVSTPRCFCAVSEPAIGSEQKSCRPPGGPGPEEREHSDRRFSIAPAFTTARASRRPRSRRPCLARQDGPEGGQLRVRKPIDQPRVFQLGAGAGRVGTSPWPMRYSSSLTRSQTHHASPSRIAGRAGCGWWGHGGRACPHPASCRSRSTALTGPSSQSGACRGRAHARRYRDAPRKSGASTGPVDVALAETSESTGCPPSIEEQKRAREPIDQRTVASVPRGRSLMASPRRTTGTLGGPPKLARDGIDAAARVGTACGRRRAVPWFWPGACSGRELELGHQLVERLGVAGELLC